MAAFDLCKRLLHFMHMIRVFFRHTLRIPCAVESGKCPTPSKYLSKLSMCWYKKNWHLTLSCLKNWFLGVHLGRHVARTEFGEKKKFGGQKNLGGQSNGFRHKMHEILLKITFNWNYLGGKVKFEGHLPSLLPLWLRPWFGGVSGEWYPVIYLSCAHVRAHTAFRDCAQTYC